MRLNWEGKTACLIASGPSLEQWQVRHAVQSGAKIIAINNNFRICPEADVLYSCDAKWWEEYSDHLAFLGHKYSLQETHRRDIFKLENGGQRGLSLDWPILKTGGNSGYQAVNLAVLFGAKRIIFLGYDMQHTDGKKHHHEDHPRPLYNAPKQCISNWIQNFNELSIILEKMGIETINCTLQTALTCFRRMDIREALPLC